MSYPRGAAQPRRSVPKHAEEPVSDSSEKDKVVVMFELLVPASYSHNESLGALLNHLTNRKDVQKSHDLAAQVTHLEIRRERRYTAVGVYPSSGAPWFLHVDAHDLAEARRLATDAAPPGVVLAAMLPGRHNPI